MADNAGGDLLLQAGWMLFWQLPSQEWQYASHDRVSRSQSPARTSAKTTGTFNLETTAAHCLQDAVELIA